MAYYDLQGQLVREEKSGQERFLRFAYGHAVTRFLMKGLIRPSVSKLAGRLMSSRFSACFIRRFVRKNGIDLSEYEDRKFASFNDFFTRALKNGARPIPDDPDVLFSPADGKVLAYRIGADSVFRIKGSDYSVRSLTKSKTLSETYRGGTAVIVRLAVNNYHWYHFIDDGTRGKHTVIPGVLHSVQPAVLDRVPVFKENCREVTLLHTERFGTVAMIEVGATLVGRIVNRGVEAFKRGDEKGRFEFGGSTVVLLFEADAAAVDTRILKASEQGIECEVRLGTPIGRSLRNDA